ncbi:hypothetical protein GF339_03455 [candidate division KSB3 bacterium]|uniref:4Fe-4S ferredoxin-type domain-containing protein n=1 Tax=candidate division KSB3 bacterium TaxID=2044937 RepID=A0A9D5JT61_9BACT|nr:hypothetical protein [candidate division KSB3 bacterium]MBD3323614.1 hypothetical protein [candidate division KSB3 bacterium]
MTLLQALQWRAHHVSGVVMGNKWVSVDFVRCNPAECNGQSGECPAAGVCTHNLLVQEELFEEPMLISAKMCVGCGDCVTACPLKALQIVSGF